MLLLFLAGKSSKEKKIKKWRKKEKRKERWNRSRLIGIDWRLIKQEKKGVKQKNRQVARGTSKYCSQGDGREKKGSR